MTFLEGWERNARLAPITPAVLREHAALVAESHRVKVHLHFRAFARGRSDVWGPQIENESAYAVRLHEIGHTQTPHAEAAGVTVELDGGRRVANSAGEAAAWTWARQHALIWTSTMQAELNRCLATYRRYAQHGLRDPIWRELQTINGRQTVGHGYQRLATMGRLKILDAQQQLARLKEGDHHAR